jgi:hypothetical protein
MIVLPIGPLTQTPLAFRVFGVIVGLAVFFLLGRKVLLAVCAGVGAFIVLVSAF